ncbi:pentatricopeptide repeat-containing protein At2g39620 [Aristolochia californica]|uniref:pentatricopeptide repeat-containing protein At2g39620 n=1 Tax=Aristolochia californica TaxID=171875 RepID=UPI0035DDDD91
MLIRAMRRLFHSIAGSSVGMARPFAKQIVYHDYHHLLRSLKNIQSLLRLHAHVLTTGLELDDIICTQLVNSYSSFGHTETARLIFDSVTKPSTVLWNSMIRAYTRSGQHEEGLDLYNVMLERGVKPDKFTFTFVIKACTGASDTGKGTLIHQEITRTGLDCDVYISAALIDMYCKAGRIETAQELFDRMPEADVVTWNIMIAGSAQSVKPCSALDIFRKMLSAGMQPNSVSFLNLFPAISRLTALPFCRSVHGFVVRRAFTSAVSNGLIDAYSKCGNVGIARLIFYGLVSKDEVSWGTMISGYVHNGYYMEALELFNDLRRKNLKLNQVSAVGALLAAAETRDIEKGEYIHTCMIQEGIDLDTTVITALMTMYAKCGNLNKARELFFSNGERDIVAWSAMIAAFSQAGHSEEAVSLFRELQSIKLKPNRITIVTILPACAELTSLNLGKSIHAYVIKADMGIDVSVGTALVAMYAKCGSFSFAHSLFTTLQNKDTVTWNALINGYAQLGDAGNTLKLFHQLQLSGVSPDSGTMVGVLPACVLLGALEQGMCFHGHIIKCGFESDLHVKNSLIDMYAKCGSFRYAEIIFSDNDFNKDEISWNIMIAGSMKNGWAKEALSYFHQMKLENLKPNLVTLVSILPAASYLAALREGTNLHSYIIRSGFISNTLVGNSLIDMYAKCGRLDLAQEIFSQMDNRDRVSWNAMLSGYAVHGHAKDALKLFSLMKDSSIEADAVSFVSILSACRHGGFVQEGMDLFEAMSSQHRLEPNVEHYACIVDLLGCAGRLEEAYRLIGTMPMTPDAGVWGALLGACRMHSNVKFGEVALDHLVSLEPQNPAHYVVLSNIYAQHRKWADVAKMRLMMNNLGLTKTPGCSWVEMKGIVHAFRAGDRSHPQFESICMVWKELRKKMEEMSYVPDTSSVLQNVEEEEKEAFLHGHSERLAMAFAIFNTEAGTTIQIVKNLRICRDCHAVTKLISTITGRKIIVRDASRFHQFENGRCSCKDYW